MARAIDAFEYGSNRIPALSATSGMAVRLEHATARPQAIALVDETIRLARAHGNPWLIACALNSAGYAYIATGTLSTDFPVTPGAFQTTYGGSPSVCSQNATNICGDVVVTKVSPNGSKLIYSTYLGGAQDDLATGIALDSNNQAYISGISGSPGLQRLPGLF